MSRRGANTLGARLRHSRCAGLVALSLLFAASGPIAAADRLFVATHTGTATDDLFEVDLASGRLTLWRVQSSGARLRAQPLQQNLFEAIGRRPDAVASPGELLFGEVRNRGGRTDAILVVEASTGWVGYLLKLGKDGRMGQLRSPLGRPAGGIAAADSSFSMLMAWGQNRLVDGAYLHHGATGRCLYLSGVDQFEDGNLTSQPCTTLPEMPFGAAMVPLQDNRGATLGFLLIDLENGDVFRVTISANDPTALTVTALTIDLGSSFAAPADGAAPSLRLAAAGIVAGNGATTAALVADALSARMALIVGLDGSQNVAVVPLAPTVSGLAAGDSPSRGITLLPRHETGPTVGGVWIFDRLGSRVLQLLDPLDDNRRTLQPVELLR